MFLIEIVLGVALPMVLLASSRFRESPKRLAIAQGMVVLGFIFQRLNVSVTAVEAATGRTYLPSVMEFMVSAGLVALGMTVFLLACRYLPVFPEGALADEEKAAADVKARAAAVVIAAPRVGAFDRT